MGVEYGALINNGGSDSDLINANMEENLKNADPKALRFAVERSKELGNTAFKKKRYTEAIEYYSRAISGDSHDKALFSNRSAAYLASGVYELALHDAEAAIALDPSWSKAYYRLGCAHMALNQWSSAVAALQKGAELDPGSTDIQSRLSDATKRVTEAIAARNAAAATERRSLVLKLRAARRDDQRLAMLNQFKQSMTAPDWELEDLEWRPTWMPSMRLSPIDPTTIFTDPKRATLIAYLTALSDLSYPKTALRTLKDHPRITAYENAITKALHPLRNPHVLVLGAGGGVLSLLAARAGAGRVTAVERTRMLYRMAKQILSSNEGIPGAENVHLLARSLFTVAVAGEEQKSTIENANLEGALSAHPLGANLQEDDIADQLPSRADVLVTDLFDHAVLGMGILPAVDHAARYLLPPGALILPSKVRVRAVLLELSLPRANGFDLSPLDTYRWYPGDEKVNLEVLPHKALSEPFIAHTLDLQARVAASQEKWRIEKEEKIKNKGEKESELNSEETEIEEESKGSETSRNPKSKGPESAAASTKAIDKEWEADFEIDVQATSSGKWNAIAFWFELEMQPSNASSPPKHSQQAEGPKEFVGDLASGVWPPATASATSSASFSSCPSNTQPALGRSWGQAVQYIDTRTLEKGTTIQLRVRQDSGQIVFTPTPPPARMRHALAPRWHYDMVQDQLRNDAYEAAVRAAVARKRDAGCGHLTVLDIGAGTGLLSMMAVRAGADEAYAVEQSAHMCDVAEETTIMNGFLGKILVLDRDVRRMDTVAKPDGTAPEMPTRADLAVFEIFDSGLIGEGVLHCLTVARAKLLARNAALVPAWAKVYAQPLEMRVDTCAGIDVSQANRWRWRPDYEGLELARCREEWRPLSDPIEVFTFDFYDVEASMRPEESILDFKITENGVVNAVAMWFDLHLDEETTLSTCPYADKGPTWQQAVQWISEMNVTKGDQIVIHARHDTFSISYEVPAQEIGKKGRSTGVPVVDPVWKAAFDGLQGVNSQLVKACVQNPLEYRAVAQAAVQFASRPHDLGLDLGQAAEFCMKMMG